MHNDMNICSLDPLLGLPQRIMSSPKGKPVLMAKTTHTKSLPVPHAILISGVFEVTECKYGVKFTITYKRGRLKNVCF